MYTKENFLEAARVVKEVTIPTNLIHSEFYSRMTGADVYLEAGELQRTGA